MVRRSGSTGLLACSRSRSKEPSSRRATYTTTRRGATTASVEMWVCSAELSNAVTTHGEQWHRSLAAEATEALACPGTGRQLPGPTHRDVSCSLSTAYRRLLRGCLSRRQWSIFVAGTRHPIGSVGFRRWSDGRPEVVYWVDPDHGGAEVVAESIHAVLGRRRRRPVVALSPTSNLGACLVLEELGFIAESNPRRHGTEQRLYVLD
jgi:hypothetical protein